MVGSFGVGGGQTRVDDLRIDGPGHGIQTGTHDAAPGFAIRQASRDQAPEPQQEAARSRTGKTLEVLGRSAVVAGCVLAGTAIMTVTSVLTTSLGLLGGVNDGLKAVATTAKKSAEYAFSKLSAREDASLVTKGLKGTGAVFAGILAGAAGAVAGTLQIPYLAASGAVTGLCLAVAAARDHLGTALQDAIAARAEMRAVLTKAHPNTGVSKDMPIASEGAPAGQDLNTVMEGLRKQLGGDKRISSEEMWGYIFMGERLALALEQQDTAGEIAVSCPGKDDPNRSITVKSNLETTRALSWYLQAKAVADNQGERPTATMGRGAVILNDPSGNLFKFLSNSANAHYRLSSHIEGQDSGERAGFGNAGLLGGMSGLRGAKVHYGIEDFSSKMPSDGGCLLFAQMSPGGGEQPNLFMKWEDVGMPTLTGNHADEADGWVAKTLNRYNANFRCLGHVFNFLNTRAEPKLSVEKNAQLPDRRERVNRQEPGELYNLFVSITRDVLSEPELKEAKRLGIHKMEKHLTELLERPEVVPEDAAKRIGINDLLDDITEFKNRMGADQGVNRMGAEIHVRLPMPIETTLRDRIDEFLKPGANLMAALDDPVVSEFVQYSLDQIHRKPSIEGFSGTQPIADIRAFFANAEASLGKQLTFKEMLPLDFSMSSLSEGMISDDLKERLRKNEPSYSTDPDRAAKTRQELLEEAVNEVTENLTKQIGKLLSDKLTQINMTQLERFRSDLVTNGNSEALVDGVLYRLYSSVAADGVDLAGEVKSRIPEELKSDKAALQTYNERLHLNSRPTVDDVLKNEVLSSHFAAFAHREGQGKYYDFYNEARKTLQLLESAEPSNEDPAFAREHANSIRNQKDAELAEAFVAIHNKYIKAGAPFAIDLPGKVRNAFVSKEARNREEMRSLLVSTMQDNKYLVEDLLGEFNAEINRLYDS